jgi:hypothetical protein
VYKWFKQYKSEVEEGERVIPGENACGRILYKIMIIAQVYNIIKYAYLYGNLL